jgi:cytochrome c oxidase assembly protein subunit 11
VKFQKPSNAVLALTLLALVSVMFSFAYANVPLFKLFCARFGLNDAGKASGRGEMAPLMSSAAGNVLARSVNVKFMGVSGTGLPVRFGPSEPQVTAKIGKPIHLSYTFTNMGDDSVFFRAVHSITPMSAAREFQLIQCFCFEDQSLGPRETRVLPVYFALSPRFPTNVNEIVLNYSLFPRDPKDRSPVVAKEVN